MKRWQKSILACTLVFALLFSTFNFNYSYAEPNQTHWATETLEKWQQLGYLLGDEQGNLAPDKKITRAEFMALINRSQGYTKLGDKVEQFTDVSSGDWYYDIVSIALEAGYIKGTSKSTISPNKLITRQEAMAILARISSATPNSVAYQFASDSADVSEWARTAASTCINEGFIIGYNGNIFPLRNMSRAEVVVMLDRKINNQRMFSLAGNYNLAGQNLSDVQILAGDINIENFTAKNLTIDAVKRQQTIQLSGVNVTELFDISARTQAKVIIAEQFAKIVNNSPDLELTINGTVEQLIANQNLTLAGKAKIAQIIRDNADRVIKVITANGKTTVLAKNANSLEIAGEEVVLEDGLVPKGSLIDDDKDDDDDDDDKDDKDNTPQPGINVIKGDKVVVDDNTKILVKRTFQAYAADKPATAPSCQLQVSNVNITANTSLDVEIYGNGVYNGLVKTVSIDLEPSDTPVTILKKIYPHATGKIGEQTYSCDAIVDYDDYATAEFVGDMVATEQNGTLINNRGLSFKFLNLNNLFDVSSYVINGNLAEQRFDDAEIKLYPGLVKQEDDKYYVVTVKLTDKIDASKSVEVAINLNDYLDNSTPLEDRLSLATYFIANTLKNDANYNARFTALKDVAEKEITIRELSKQDVDVDISFEYSYPTDDIKVIKGDKVVVDDNTKILVKRTFQAYAADKPATAPSCQLQVSNVNITANTSVDVEIYGNGLYNGLVKTVSIDLEPSDTPVSILKKIYPHATGEIGEQTYRCDAIVDYDDYATAEFVGDMVATEQNGTLINNRGLSFKFLTLNNLFDVSSYVINGNLAEQRFDDAEIKLYPGLFKQANDKFYIVTVKLTDKADASKSIEVEVDLNSFLDVTVKPQDRLAVATYGIANALNNDTNYQLRFAALNDQQNNIVTLRELSKQDIDVDISFEYAYPSNPGQDYTPEIGDATDFKVDWVAFDYQGLKNKSNETGENYLYIQFNKPANQSDAMNLDNYYFSGKELSKVNGAAVVGGSIDGLVNDNAWQAVTIALPKSFRPGNALDFSGEFFIKKSLKAEDGTAISTDKVLGLNDTASDSNFRDQDKVFEALYTAEKVIVNQLKQGRVNPEIGIVDGKVDSIGLMLEDQFSGAQVVPDSCSIKLYNNGIYSGNVDSLTLDTTQSNLADVDVLTSASVFYGAKAVSAEKNGEAVKFYLINNRITNYYDIWHYLPSQWSDGWIAIYGYNNTIDECRSVVKNAYLNNPNTDHATLVVEHSEYVGRGIYANGTQYEGNTVTLESAAGIDHNLKLLTPQQDGMALKIWEYSLEKADLLTENDLVRAIGDDANDRRVLDYGYLSNGDVGVAADNSVAVKIDNLNTVATDFKVDWAAFDDAPFGSAHDYLYIKFNKPADETAVKQLANYTFNGKNLAQLGATVTNGIQAVTAADYEAITIELPADTLDGPYQAYSTDLVLNSSLVASDGTAISSSGPLYFSYIKNETTRKEKDMDFEAQYLGEYDCLLVVREVVTGKELSANPTELSALIDDLNYDINYYSDPAHPDPAAVQAAQAKLDVISQYKNNDGKLDFIAMTFDYGSNEDLVPEEMIVKLGNGGSYLGARKRTINNQHPAGFYFNAMALVSPIEDVAVNTGLDVFKEIEYVDGFKHVNDEHVKMKAFIINMVESDADLVNADPDKIKSLDLCAPIIDTAKLADPNAVDSELLVTFSEPVATDNAHQNNNGVKIIDGQQFNLTRTNAIEDLTKFWTFDVTNANQISKSKHLVAPDIADNKTYVIDVNNKKLKAVNAEIENANGIAYDPDFKVEWAAFDNNGSVDGNDYLYIKFNKPVSSATAKDIIFNGKDLSTLSGVTVSEKVRGVTAEDFVAITLTLPANSLDSASADFATTLSFKVGYAAADGAALMTSSQTLNLADTVNDGLIKVGNAKDQITDTHAFGTASGRRDKWDTVFRYIEPDMQFEAEYLGDYDGLLVTKEFVVGAEDAANFDGKVDAVALKLASGDPTNLPETLSVKLANKGVYRGDIDTSRNYYNNMPLVSDEDDVDVFTSASIFIGMQVEEAQKQENGTAKDLNVFLINLLQDNRAGIRSAIRNPMYVIVDDARPMIERAWLDDPTADNTTLNVRFSEWVYAGNTIGIKDGAQFNLQAIKLPNIRLGYGRNQKYSVEKANQINKDENILLAGSVADFSDCDPTYNTNCSVYDAVYKIENAIGGPAPADETLAVEWAAFDNNGAADGNDYLYIMFNKSLDEASAQDLANYTFAGTALTEGTVTNGIKGVVADPWTAITLTLPANTFDSNDANFATTLVLSDTLTGSDGSIIAADKRTLALADTENDGHIIIGNRASDVDASEKAYGTTRNSYLAVDGTTYKSYSEDDMRFEAEYLGDYDALLVAKKYMFVDPNSDGKVDALAMQFSDGIAANVPEELIMTLNNGASYQGQHVERDLGQGKDEPYFNNMGIVTDLADVTEMTSAELFYGMTLEDVAGGKLFFINFLNEDADHQFFLNNYSSIAHYELQDDARPKLVSAVLADPNADTTELTVKFSEIVYGAEKLRFVTDTSNSKFKLSLQTPSNWPDYPDTCVYTVEKANEIVKDTDLLKMTGGSDLGDLGEGNNNVSFIPFELEIANASGGTNPIANLSVIEKCDVPPAGTAIVVTEDFNDFAINKDATAPSCELTISDVNIAQAGGQFVLKIKDDDNGAQLLKTVTINLEAGDDAVTIMQKIAAHLLTTLGQNTYTCDTIYVCDDVAKATFVGSGVGTGNLGVSLVFEALDSQFKPNGFYLRGKDAYKENFDQAELNVYAPIVELTNGKYGKLELKLTNNDDAQKSYQTVIDFEQADYKAALDSATTTADKLTMVVRVIEFALANDSAFTNNYVLLPDASNAQFIIRDLSGEDANIDTEVVFNAAQSTVQNAAVAKDIVDTLDDFASNTVAKTGTQQVISLTVDEDTNFATHDEEVFFTNGLSKTFTIDGQVVAKDIFEAFDNGFFGQNNIFFGFPTLFGIYYWQHDDQIATFTSLGAGVEVNKLSDAKLNSDATPTAITVAVEDGTGTDLDADIATLQLKPGRWNIGAESAITLVFNSDIEGLNPGIGNPLEIDVVFDAAEYEATEIAAQIANKLNNEHLFSDYFTAAATANQVIITTDFKGVESPIEISIK